MSKKDLPEVTPYVLFKRIVPRLKTDGWQITRGRGLEEGDRIYRPGCKTKGKLAIRDEDFFVCYEGSRASSALVNYVFDNEILTPEQVWTPHELSTIDDSKGSIAVEDSTANAVGNEAAIQPKPKAKRKNTKKNTESGKSKKKAKTSQELPPKSSSTKRIDFGLHLLQQVSKNMLECAIEVNRRWRKLRDEHDLSNEQVSWIPVLAEEIEAAQLDLKLNVDDVVMWARKSRKQSIPVPENFQLPYFRTWKAGLIQLIEQVRDYIQTLVVAVRAARRALCGDDSGLLLNEGGRPYRSSTCEYLSQDIRKLQDDLRGATNEMLSEFKDQFYVSENTDTDDEL